MGSAASMGRAGRPLAEVELPVYDWATCRGFPALNARTRVQPSQLCAGGKAGKDTCQVPYHFTLGNGTQV